MLFLPSWQVSHVFHAFENYIVPTDCTLLHSCVACLICRTSAKFFAILDRQSTSDAKESLERYHARVSTLVEKHQLGGYYEVYSTTHNSRVT